MTPERYTTFHKALKQHPDVARRLGRKTVWRYAQGDVPRSIQLLIDNPGLFETFVALVTTSDAKTDEAPKGYGSASTSLCPTCHLPMERAHAESCDNCAQ